MKKILILILACCITVLSYSQDDFQSYGTKNPTAYMAGFVPWCYTTPLVYLLGISNGGFALKRAGVLFCNNCPDDPLTIPTVPQYMYYWDTNLIYETDFIQPTWDVSFAENDVFRQRWFIETTSGLIFYGNIEENTVTCEPPSLGISPSVSTCSGDPSKTYNSANICGVVIDQGTSSVTDFGVVYSTNPNPTTGNNISYGSGNPLIQWSVTLSGLTPNTKYYYKAFAESADGVGYGSEYSFTTPYNQTTPTLTTNLITAINTNSAVSGGVISNGGGAPVIEKGVCYKIGSTPSYSDTKTSNGSGTDSFTSNMTGLSENTTYHVRAYARNRVDAGGFYVYATGYGQEEIFTTTGPPTILATLTSLFASETTTTYSVYWGISLASAATSPVSFTVNATNTTNTGTTPITIAFKIGESVSWSNAVVYNKLSSTYTAYCNFGTMPSGFTGTNSTSYLIPALSTPCSLPTIAFYACSNVTSSSVQVSAHISSDGGCSVTSRGFDYCTDGTFTTILGSVTVGSGTGGYDTVITGLQCNTRYYFRPWVTNSVGTCFGVNCTDNIGTDCTTSACPSTPFYTRINMSNCGVYDITNTTTLNQACVDVKNISCGQIQLTVLPSGGNYYYNSFSVGSQLYSDSAKTQPISTSFYSLAYESATFKKVVVAGGVIQSITTCP